MKIRNLLGATLLVCPLSVFGFNLSLEQNAQPLDLAYHSAQPLVLAVNDAPADTAAPDLATGQRPQDRKALLDSIGLEDIPTTPDRDGLWDDSKLFLLYQAGVVGVLWFSPESTSQWDDEDKKGNIFKKWDDNVHNLRRDKDDWGINYVGHPYFGAVYYVRARNRGYTRQNSFWYSVTMSTLYEYGIEALFEPVSVQDLIFTPVGGAILGEYFMNARANIRNRITRTGEVTFMDKVNLFLTDPLGAVNKKVTSMVHKEASLNLYPVISPARNSQATANHSQKNDERYYGVQAMLRW